MRSFRIALTLIVIGLSATASLAQSGGLRVVVTDAQGALPGATVTLSNEQGYIKAETQLTDPKGVVVFPVLRAGTGYVLEVSFPGMSTVRQSDLKVKIGETQTIPVQLTTELVEKVEVTAERKVVDLEKPTQSTKFSDEFMQNLPIPGKAYQSVLTLAPGVQDDDNDGNPTVYGSRARDFKATVSGISNVDPLTGQYMSEVSLNSIEEMEVVTAGAGAEFGRAQGGYAQIVQKQGTNEFEGVFDMIWRSSKLDGNGASNATGSQVPKFDWYQPSIQVSGPIVKDRLWYRLTHEYQYIQDPQNFGNRIDVTTYKQGINSDQLTWQVSPRNKLVFLFDYNPQTITNFGVNAFTPVDSSLGSELDYKKYSLAWTAPYSTKILVESNFAFQDSSRSRYPTSPNAVNDCITDPNRPDLSNTQCVDFTLNTTTGAYPETYKDHRQRFTALSDATVYAGRFLGMSHQLKFGFSVENERFIADYSVKPQILNFLQSENQSNQTGGPGQLDREEVLIATFSVPSAVRVHATGTVFSGYVSDQFRPIESMVVTLGVNVSREATDSAGGQFFDPEAELQQFIDESGNVPAFEKSRLALELFTSYPAIDDLRTSVANQLGNGIEPSDVNCSFCGLNSFAVKPRGFENIALRNTNVAPRLSITWDPFNDGKTKVSASAGRYFNNVPLLIPLRELLPVSVTVQINCLNGNCQPGGRGDARPTITMVDRNLRTPYQDEWRLGFERQIAQETSLSVSYVNRRYRDQIQDIDINHAPGDYGRCLYQNQPGDPTVQPITDPEDPLYGMYPNGGDGIIDDCVGRKVIPTPNPDDPGGGGIGSGFDSAFDRPDGIPDLYVQNPIWGNVYVVGNYNYSNYEAYILELVRRQYRGWQMEASYTWSKSKGNGEDFFQQNIGNDRTLLEDEKGYQSTDRRHAIKVNAITITPWGFRFGMAVQWLSGLPYSVLVRDVSNDAIPPVLEGTANSVARPRLRYVTGVRNDQRNPSYWNIDVRFIKELRVGNRINMQLSAEIFNLLNDGTFYNWNDFPNQQYGREINGIFVDRRQRFGRRFQLGAKVTF